MVPSLAIYWKTAVLVRCHWLGRTEALLSVTISGSCLKHAVVGRLALVGTRFEHTSMCWNMTVSKGDCVQR